LASADSENCAAGIRRGACEVTGPLVALTRYLKCFAIWPENREALSPSMHWPDPA